jgi:biotin operon repressor
MARKGKLGRPVDPTGRSKGNGQYVPLPYAMLHSPAWRSLSGSAVKVFLELRTRFHGANNGRLTLSLDEAARLLGLGKATVKRALEELQEKGLVVQTRRGQWYGRLASTWATTDKPIEGMGSVQGWTTWRPSPSAQKSFLGSRMDPSAAVLGSEMERRRRDGSISEPVSRLRVVGFGSRMDR